MYVKVVSPDNDRIYMFETPIAKLSYIRIETMGHLNRLMEFGDWAIGYEDVNLPAGDPPPTDDTKIDVRVRSIDLKELSRPTASILVFPGANVFLMNDDGKTIDTWN